MQSSFGPTFAWEQVVDDLERALAGRLAIRARLAERARTLRRRRRGAPPQRRRARGARSTSTASATPTVVEVHAPDGVGVLYRITRALAELDLDIVGAKVQTLGAQVVDSFYVRGADGAKVTDPGVLAEAERALLHAPSSPG